MSAMDKVDCSVLYSESSQSLIKADGSRAAGDVKLTAVHEMQKQITNLTSPWRQARTILYRLLSWKVHARLLVLF